MSYTAIPISLVVENLRRHLPVADIARAVGVRERAVRHWALGSHAPRMDAEMRLRDLGTLIEELERQLGGENVRPWLHSRQVALGGARPLDALLAGDVRSLLEAVPAGAPKGSGTPPVSLAGSRPGRPVATYAAPPPQEDDWMSAVLTATTRMARSMGLQDPDDAIQDAMLRAYRVWHSNPNASVSTLVAAARHALRMRVSNEARKRAATPEEVPTESVPSPGAQSWEDDVATSQALRADITSQLSTRDRELLVLLASGLTYSEIAELTAVTANAVAQRIHRLRRRLRTLLAEVEQVP